MKKNTLLNIFAVVLAAGFFALLALIGQLQQDFIEDTFSADDRQYQSQRMSGVTTFIADHHSEVDSNARAYLAERDYAENDYVHARGLTPRNASESNVRVTNMVNPSQNGDCDMRVTVLDANDAWTSPWISPGQSVEVEGVEFNHEKSTVIRLRPNAQAPDTSCSRADGLAYLRFEWEVGAPEKG